MLSCASVEGLVRIRDLAILSPSQSNSSHREGIGVDEPGGRRPSVLETFVGMITPKLSTLFPVAAGLLALFATFAMLGPISRAQDQSGTRAAEDTRWLATAPGEVEPGSGEIKIASSVAGRIAEVLIKAKDTVFAGELLVRLEDDDLRARVKVAEAQAALQKRVRNDDVASARAADRRKVEDAVADAEKAVVDARSAVDRSSAATRKNSAPESALAAARMVLSRAQDRLNQQQADLRKLDAQSNVPLPTQPEGQLNIARAELAYANALLEKMIIRAPIAGTVLQVNAKAGELASPSSVLPLVLIGDVSTLRVRAEVAELNIGAIKLGQPVLVRAASFRERGFAGKVSSIAPSVEPRRIGEDGQRPPSDSKFVQVFVDLIDPGPLVVGMSVDVYFRPDATQ
jgi:HlyD family secretion protein